MESTNFIQDVEIIQFPDKLFAFNFPESLDLLKITTRQGFIFEQNRLDLALPIVVEFEEINLGEIDSK